MRTKVLIVEDEPIIAEDLKMILEKEEYHIIGIANEGSMALDLLHSQKPDIVLLDIALDFSMSGFDIADVINTKYKIPFIFITSFSDKYTLDRAKSVFPHGYIVKPFKKKDIIANIEIALFRNKQTQHNKIPYYSIDEFNELHQLNVTSKEFDIIIDVAHGLDNQALSDKHNISLNTVKTHLKRVFLKLNIKNRSQIAAMAMRK